MAEPELCSTDLLVRLKGNVSAHLSRQIVQLEENSIFQRKHHPVPNHTVIVWLTTSKELEFSPCQIVKGKELKFSPCQREGCPGTRRWRPHHRNDPPGSIQVASKLVCLEKKFFVCFLPGKKLFFFCVFCLEKSFFLCFLPGKTFFFCVFCLEISNDSPSKSV